MQLLKEGLEHWAQLDAVRGKLVGQDPPTGKARGMCISTKLTLPDCDTQVG